MTIKGVLFDLDGVITDTAKLHFQAWKKLADSLNIDIDEEFNEKLKGVDRAGSLDLILAHGNVELAESLKLELMKQKNSHYVDLLQTLTFIDILPGISELLESLNKHNIRVSIASISRNAPIILEKLGLMEFVDAIADPATVAHSKPAPDIFLEAARLINVPLDECIGIEDSEAGIEAIKRAGIKSIGVGVEGGDITLKSTDEIWLKLEGLITQ